MLAESVTEVSRCSLGWMGLDSILDCGITDLQVASHSIIGVPTLDGSGP